MEFDLSYTSEEITPWGGMVFLKQMLQKIGFREHISKCEELRNLGLFLRGTIETLTKVV